MMVIETTTLLVLWSFFPLSNVLHEGWLLGSHTSLLYFSDFMHLPRSVHTLSKVKSFSTTWFHVIFDLPLLPTPSISYIILLSSHSSSSFHNTMSPPFQPIPVDILSHQFNIHSLPQLYTWSLIPQRHTTDPSQGWYLYLLKSSSALYAWSESCFHTPLHPSHTSHTPSFLTSIPANTSFHVKISGASVV